LSANNKPTDTSLSANKKPAYNTSLSANNKPTDTSLSAKHR